MGLGMPIPDAVSDAQRRSSLFRISIAAVSAANFPEKTASRLGPARPIEKGQTPRHFAQFTTRSEISSQSLPTVRGELFEKVGRRMAFTALDELHSLGQIRTSPVGHQLSGISTIGISTISTGPEVEFRWFNRSQTDNEFLQLRNVRGQVHAKLRGQWSRDQSGGRPTRFKSFDRGMAHGS
jgi:hypothetical protein